MADQDGDGEETEQACQPLQGILTLMPGQLRISKAETMVSSAGIPYPASSWLKKGVRLSASGPTSVGSQAMRKSTPQTAATMIQGSPLQRRNRVAIR